MKKALNGARFIAPAFCLGGFLLFSVQAAVAQNSSSPNAVVISLSDVITPIANIVSAMASALIAGLLAKYGGGVAKAGVTDQLLKRSIDYGVATVAGAAKGKEVTIPVANDVLRVAAQYAADNAPHVVRELGDTLMPKLIARLGSAVQLPVETALDNLTGGNKA